MQPTDPKENEMGNLVTMDEARAAREAADVTPEAAPPTEAPATPESAPATAEPEAAPAETVEAKGGQLALLSVLGGPAATVQRVSLAAVKAAGFDLKACELPKSGTVDLRVSIVGVGEQDEVDDDGRVVQVVRQVLLEAVGFDVLVVRDADGRVVYGEGGDVEAEPVKPAKARKPRKPKAPKDGTPPPSPMPEAPVADLIADAEEVEVIAEVPAGGWRDPATDELVGNSPAEVREWFAKLHAGDLAELAAANAEAIDAEPKYQNREEYLDRLRDLVTSGAFVWPELPPEDAPPVSPEGAGPVVGDRHPSVVELDERKAAERAAAAAGAVEVVKGELATYTAEALGKLKKHDLGALYAGLTGDTKPLAGTKPVMVAAIVEAVAAANADQGAGDALDFDEPNPELAELAGDVVIPPTEELEIAQRSDLMRLGGSAGLAVDVSMTKAQLVSLLATYRDDQIPF